MMETYEVFRRNVEVVTEITRILATSLGPAGKAKLFITPEGKKFATNSGKTILRLLPLENPVARLTADFADDLDDGVKSAFVFANSLLLRTLKLARNGMHPMRALPIYQVCAGKTTDFLLKSGERLRKITDSDLRSIVENVFITKGIAQYRKNLASLLVSACQSAVKQNLQTDTGKYVDLSLVSIFSERSGHLDESQLIHGAVVTKGVSYPLMPKQVKKARIAMLSSNHEFETLSVIENITVNNQKERCLLKEKRAYLVNKLVNTIKRVGANVVINKFKMSHLVLQKMAEEGVLVVDQVDSCDLERLLRAVGGRLVSTLDILTPEDLGKADLVKEIGKPSKRFLVFTGCMNPAPVLINLRCVSDYLLFEARDALMNATWQIKDIIESGMIIYGAGSIEAWLADYMRDWAQNLLGIEQITAMEYAAALEEIPRQLIKNAGFSPSRTIAMIRDRRRKEGYPWWGIDINNGDIMDAKIFNVVEPLNRTKRYLETATNLVEMVIMLDEPLIIKGRIKNSPSAHMITTMHHD